ncbi:GspH/FimT family pseudopilin [methane-oxidizing endosymbiont of Gigantopelta aegis]|uniref:GspH/FimT family pseudopilin n=1 Tax=methane-oxidizing endosymbiont of Gigantopelta aegis TaxID=2794938 RepID=UPI0018DC07F7|nr:GspH/FimT family pseudopilin [methane-oxidizing endosymbiont of Gigantopelta aegis]
MKAARSIKGFTLLELMIVLFIVVLAVGAISINIANGNPASQIKAAARDMASALRYARGQALISRKRVWVSINLIDNSYRISDREKKFILPESIRLTLTLAENTVKNEEGRVVFYPDSSSSGGRIELEQGGFYQRIDINWINGNVTVVDE